MNPSTKEAFDKSEISRLPLHPIDSQTIGQLRKREVSIPIKQENCFSVFGSQNINHAITRLSDKEKYSNEALALQKLMMPLGTNETTKKTIACGKTPLKVPNNNPFRITKHNEETIEEISIVSSIEYIDLDDFMSPSNSREKVSKNEEISVVSSVEYIDLDNYTSPQEKGSANFARKRKFENVCLDKVEAKDEQVSGVTEVECSNAESQESVKSKVKKSKISNSKKKGSNIRTILNFFSRV